MTEERIRTDRLRELAAHIVGPNRGHKVFDFTQWNSAREPKCGTAGCAMGECPILWPNDWRFDNYGYPLLITNFECSIVDSGMEWFNINDRMFGHLFTLRHQYTDKYGGKELDGNATAEEVANNILIFCDKVDKGEIK